MSRNTGVPLRRVVREFTRPNKYAPDIQVRMVELECGHVKRDPWDVYGNETAVRVRAELDALHKVLEPATYKPRRCRCMQCKTGAAQITGTV